MHVRTMGGLAGGCRAAGHEHGGRAQAGCEGITALRQARWPRPCMGLDEDRTESEREAQVDREALLEAKDETIRILEEQLRLCAEEIQRRDVIISQLTQANAALAARVPELEAAESREEGDQGAAEGGVRVGYPAGDTGHTEGSERPRDTAEFPAGGTLTRPWWRRVFGG